MGLLDDAIREHLDLKRRRGGDPTEIERAEREALGPVRRGAELTGEEEVAAPGASLAPEADYSPAPPEADFPPAPPEPDYPPESVEQWEPFREDPELRELEHPEELTPYEPARAPDGDPLMDDEPFSGKAHETLPPEPADIAPAPAPEAEPPLPHPADPPPAARDDAPRTRVDQETEEYELEPEEEGGDDVLESTPEFLQDAPEHDRLWFEQRPPRDFDFDG
jgi:hypothetical protein